jgi:hypothetical protein
MCPWCGAVFCDGDEVGAKEYRGYAIDAEKLGSEWRGMRGLQCGAGSKIFEEGRGEVFGENSLVRFEFESLSGVSFRTWEESQVVRTSAFGVSSVCMKIVRRDVAIGEARDILNVGLDGFVAECIGRVA